MEDGGIDTDSSEVECNSAERRRRAPEFRVYKRRWFILLVLCVLNCSNSVLILGSWLNMAGGVVRVVGVLNSVPENTMFPVVMAGQTLCSLAQPLVVFSPTKLSALWFPEHQRATANMIASMCIGIFTCFATLLEQILCVKGYQNDFAGLCGALFIIFGVLGAAFLGIFVDKTKMFTESIKISMCLTSLSCTAFAVVSQFGEQKVIIGAVSALFGLFGFATYPVAMELSVECSYPVDDHLLPLVEKIHPSEANKITWMLVQDENNFEIMNMIGDPEHLRAR
ncbi:major facilitator superfamily domain-containing protein 7, partial [Clarias magur]